MIKEHGFFLGRPVEIEIFNDTILFRDTILQRTFVECQGWEVTQAGMHTILNLKSDRSNTEANKSLKQTLVESSFCSLLAHNNRTELAMITNQNNVFCSLENRNESFWFSSLCGFINQYLGEAERL